VKEKKIEKKVKLVMIAKKDVKKENPIEKVINIYNKTKTEPKNEKSEIEWVDIESSESSELNFSSLEE